MKKLFGFSLILALVALPGCVFTDYPNPTQGVPVQCNDSCEGVPNGNAVQPDWHMGTAGPNWYFLPGEEGEYYFTAQNLDPGVVEGPSCDWEGAGGGGMPVGVDTYRNEGGGQGVGCPGTYTCTWSGPADPQWYGSRYATCWFRGPSGEPENGAYDTLCNQPTSTPCMPLFWGQYNPVPQFDTEIHRAALDETPADTCEFMNNVYREPGQICDPCGAGDDMADADDTADAGAGGGGGNQLPDGDLAPEWMLAMCWFGNVPSLEALLNWGKPYAGADDYAGSSVSVSAANLLTDLARYHTANDEGFIQVPIAKISEGFNSVTLSSPVTFEVKLGWANGRIAQKIAFANDQSGISEMVEFLLKATHDGQRVDLSRFSIETTAGMVVDFGDLGSALPSISISHERLRKVADLERVRR